jgi:hypothetical protein
MKYQLLESVSNLKKGTTKFTINENDYGTVIPPAKLIWTYFEYDQSIDLGFKEVDINEFPDIDTIRNNYTHFIEVKDKHKKLLGCKEFWQKFQESKEVFLLDKFFDADCLQRVIDEIKKVEDKKDYEVKSVVIFHCQGQNKHTMMNEKLCREVHLKANIEIHMLQKTYIHDRFALMDGEIWHCGATIGGMHECLNAISRGWKDNGNKMMKYMTQLKKESR